jgi:hypothetical protein
MAILCKALVHFSMMLNHSICRLAKDTSLLLILFIIILNSPVYSQKTAPQLPQFSLGICGGPNISYSAYGDRDVQKHFRPGVVAGYSLGGFVKFPLKNRYSFITEASFAQKGRTTNFNDNWNNRTTFYMVGGAMALRKSFEVKFKKNTPMNLFVGAGPAIDYILSAHGRIKVTPGGRSAYDVVFNGTPDSDFRNDYYTDANRWLFGLDLRAGGDAPLLRNQRIYIEVRFTWGQTYLGKKNSSSYLEIVGFEDDLRFNLKTLHLIAYYALDFDTKKSRMGKSSKEKEIRRRR